MLQLARVPCTELKIDRAFVNGASHNRHLRILLESALDIASKLNLEVVAEEGKNPRWLAAAAWAWLWLGTGLFRRQADAGRWSTDMVVDQ
jgi:hypothetical protein